GRGRGRRARAAPGAVVPAVADPGDHDPAGGAAVNRQKVPVVAAGALFGVVTLVAIVAVKTGGNDRQHRTLDVDDGVDYGGAALRELDLDDPPPPPPRDPPLPTARPRPPPP